jgi:hypothetical protein
MQVTMMKDFAFGTKKLREFNVVREAGQHYSNDRSGQRWQRHNEEVSILNIITAAISLHYDLSILTNNESCNQTHPSSQLLDKTSSSAVLSTSLELH